MEILRSIVLMLISSFFSLLLIEGGFRGYSLLRQSGSVEEQLERSNQAIPVTEQGNVSLAGIIRPSIWPDVVYELKPNATYTFQGKPVRTNSHGMRGPEVKKERDPNTIRIVGLGDSIMFGWGVNEDESYLSLLARTLKLSKPVEVLNFGVPGYNTAMEISLYENRIREFQPDLIIVQFVNNDFDVPAFMMKQEDPLDFSKSFLWDFISQRIKSDKKSSLVGISEVTGKRKGNARVIEKYKPMTGAGAVKKALAKLRSLAGELPIIVFYGAVSKEQGSVLRSAAKANKIQLLPIGPFVKEYFEANNLPNNPADRKKLLTVAPNDRHPSPLGHKIIAEALAKTAQSILGTT